MVVSNNKLKKYHGQALPTRNPGCWTVRIVHQKQHYIRRHDVLQYYFLYFDLHSIHTIPQLIPTFLLNQESSSCWAFQTDWCGCTPTSRRVSRWAPYTISSLSLSHTLFLGFFLSQFCKVKPHNTMQTSWRHRPHHKAGTGDDETKKIMPIKYISLPPPSFSDKHVYFANRACYIFVSLWGCWNIRPSMHQPWNCLWGCWNIRPSMHRETA